MAQNDFHSAWQWRSSMVHVQQHHHCQCDSCQCRQHANFRKSKWRELSPDYGPKLSEPLLNNEDGIPDNHQAICLETHAPKRFEQQQHHIEPQVAAE
eukprot:5989588-Karenia_brevis.AAC.1